MHTSSAALVVPDRRAFSTARTRLYWTLVDKGQSGTNGENVEGKQLIKGLRTTRTNTMDAVVDDDKKAFDVDAPGDEDAQPDPDEQLMLDQGHGRVWLVKVAHIHGIYFISY
jgi:hypothetical protein